MRFFLVLQVSYGGPLAVNGSSEDTPAVPMCLVLLLPRHPLRRSIHHDAVLLDGSPQRYLSFRQFASLFSRFGLAIVVQANASRFGMAFGDVQLALDAGQIIVVVIDSSRCGQVFAFDVCSTVSNAVARGPLFVTLETG